MTLKLELDLAKCCACGACAIACMDQNDIDLSTGVRPFRTVFRQENRRTGEIAYYSMGCMHCDNAPCVTACPSGCLYKDTETGLTLYDNTSLFVIPWTAHQAPLSMEFSRQEYWSG